MGGTVGIVLTALAFLKLSNREFDGFLETSSSTLQRMTFRGFYLR
jgi:hypothetical protein